MLTSYILKIPPESLRPAEKMVTGTRTGNSIVRTVLTSYVLPASQCPFN